MKQIGFRAPALLGAGLILAVVLLAATPGERAEAARDARLVKGQVIPPDNAPYRVKRAIRAGNRIARGTDYCYGGGHDGWRSSCYDCSGAVSYVLGDRGARVLRRPRTSGDFMRWRSRGRGDWITVIANEGHVYAVIAGVRFDTSMTRGEGPGWSEQRRSARGYAKRHPRKL